MALKRRIKKKAIIAEIEALHNIITGNHILYTEEAIDSVLNSWIQPYFKPVILHHKDEDGETVGRVIKAEKAKSVINPDYYTLLLTCKISNSKAKEGIKDGRYLTTSVGVSGTDVECSICGHKISSGTQCMHQRGKRYKGQLCYWIVRKMTAKEISFVIVPSDKYSQVIRYYYEDEKENVIKLKESLNPNFIEGDGEEMDLKEALEEIARLQGELETITAEKAAFEADNTALKESMAALETEKAELQESINTLTADKQTLETSLQESQTSLENEVQLREGLEVQLEQIRLIEKEHLVDEVITLREKLGLRKIEKDTLSAKAIDTLKESLEDLQAEIAFKESLNTPSPTEEPVPNMKDIDPILNTDVPIKESLKQPTTKVKASTVLSKILN